MTARKGDTEKIFSVALHPRKALMAFGCETNVVKIYDVHRYAYVRILPLHGLVLAVRFSPCGNYLATASSSLEHDIYRVVVWKITCEPAFKLEKLADDNIIYENLQQQSEGATNGGIQQFFLHQGRIESLEFLPKANNQPCQLLASGSEDQTVRLWSFHSGNEEKEEGWTEVWRNHTGTVTCVRSSIDGAFLASASDEDRTICVWKLIPNLASTDVAKGGYLSNDGQHRSKHYVQVVQFRARSPVYALSFFPVVQRWGNSSTKRYLLACGTEKRIILLKVVSASMKKGVNAVNFVEEFAGKVKDDSSEWQLMDTVLQQKGKKDDRILTLKLGGPKLANSLQIEVDFVETLDKKSSEQAESSDALKTLDTSVHFAEENGKREMFLVCVGGGNGGSLFCWVFTPLEENLKLKHSFSTYAAVKRVIVERRYLDQKEKISGDEEKTNAEREDELERKKKTHDKRMYRLRHDHVKIGEHMAGSTINGIALPILYPGNPSDEHKKLLNFLRDDYKILKENEFIAVSVSDDETVRVFKFGIKEPKEVEIDADMHGDDTKQKVAKKGGIIGVLKKVKDVAGEIITNKKDENKKESLSFCVASGTISKTTKRMDGTLVLQRDLTENQANQFHLRKEQAREKRKAKEKIEQEANAQEFRFSLKDESRKEDDPQASKFTHFQNLAEPQKIPKNPTKRTSLQRDQCEGGCNLM